MRTDLNCYRCGTPCQGKPYIENVEIKTIANAVNFTSTAVLFGVEKFLCSKCGYLSIHRTTRDLSDTDIVKIFKGVMEGLLDDNERLE